MRIHNVRQGFATNSSSSHSMILLDEYVEQGIPAYGYGTSDFILTEEDEKLKYLIAMAQTHLRDMCYDDTWSKSEMEKALDMSLDHVWPEEGYENLIDHQSVMSLPFAWYENRIDTSFLRALWAYMRDERCKILGGSDENRGTRPPGYGPDDAFRIPLPMEAGMQSVCRYDEVYKYWTAFNRHTGYKCRFTLEPSKVSEQFVPWIREGRYDPFINQRVVVQASVPELVDIKITDACPFVKAPCYATCYQGSHPKGQHASLQALERIAQALADMRVFEVAIGGGEPTFHPQFNEIITMFKSYGIVANFTTRNREFFRTMDYAEAFEHAGAMAVSVTYAHELRSQHKAFKRGALSIFNLPFTRTKVNFQHVLGTTSAREFDELMEEAQKQGASMTLLGYKDSNRGASKAPHKIDNWIDIVRKYTHRVSIDTVLAAQSQEALAEAGVPHWMYDVKDGLFSMYIDAVNGTVGPSSYSPKSSMVTCDPSAESYTEAFQNFEA